MPLLDRLPLASARAWAARHRRPLVAVRLTVAVALAALILPAGLPDEVQRVDGRDAFPLPMQRAPAEDLGAFLANRRWGVSLQEIAQTEAAATAAQGGSSSAEINAALAKIGFLGLMVEGQREERKYAVLLALPDGRIARLAGGDALPDGRILASVAGHSLTLTRDDGQEEVLALFPRVGAD